MGTQNEAIEKMDDMKGFHLYMNSSFGKFEGKIMDEDGNSKNMNLKQLDSEEIYRDSNNLYK